MTDLIKHIRAGGEVQTRDGRAVTIYTTEADGRYPIVGAVKGDDRPAPWTAQGKWAPKDLDGYFLDLIPIPAKPKRKECYITAFSPNPVFWCVRKGPLERRPGEPRNPLKFREVLPDDIDPDAARELVEAVGNAADAFSSPEENWHLIQNVLDAHAKAKGEA